MYEIGYWGRPGHPDGARHVVFTLNGERLTYCGAHKMLVPDVEFNQVASGLAEGEVTCGHCKRILSSPTLRLKHLGEEKTDNVKG